MQKELYDTVEWAAIQDWCDGNVAFYGYSYFGIIQALVAAMQPPHLKCIMPFSYTEDYYQHGYYGEAPSAYMFMYWELCPANNPVSYTTKMMSEEEMKHRIEEVLKDPDIGKISYFLKILHV